MRHTIPYTKYYRLKSSVRATTVYADLGLQIVAVTVSQAGNAPAVVEDQITASQAPTSDGTVPAPGGRCRQSRTDESAPYPAYLPPRTVP